MLIFVRQKYTGELFTIKKSDKEEFLRLKSFFAPDPFNFELIENKDDIKHLLETEFASYGRGEEYDESLPSVTKIAYQIYPKDINDEKFLIKYLNNKQITEQDLKDNQETLNLGTLTHRVIEAFVNDKQNRKPLIEQIKILNSAKKQSKKLMENINSKFKEDLKRYFIETYNDDEIKRKVKNIDELKEQFENMCFSCLPDFFKELIMADLVYSEIFISVPNFLQGSIDFVAYLNNKFSIIDFKTTRTLDKKTNKPKFKTNSQLEPYSRQLAIYYELLKYSEMTHIPKDEYPNFYIYQIHLIGNKFKKFEIPQNMVKYSMKEVSKILEWYWAIRNGTEYIENNLEEDELDFISL